MKYFLSFFCLLLSNYSFSQNSEYNNLLSEARQEAANFRYKLAEEKIKKAIEIDSSRVAAYYYLGMIYYISCEKEGKNCELCIANFNKCKGENQDYENPYFYTGRCKGTLRDFQGALNDFSIAIRKHPDSLVYLSRAKIKIQLKDYLGACEDYYQSAALGSVTAKEIFDRNCYTKPKEK
jgi:tetratricopeptide (TPR) repeat protein